MDDAHQRIKPYTLKNILSDKHIKMKDQDA
jgi:hypothetical protein